MGSGDWTQAVRLAQQGLLSTEPSHCLFFFLMCMSVHYLCSIWKGQILEDISTSETGVPDGWKLLCVSWQQHLCPQPLNHLFSPPIFTSNYVYVTVCVCASACECSTLETRSQCWIPRSWSYQAVVSLLMEVLGTELWSCLQKQQALVNSWVEHLMGVI